MDSEFKSEIENLNLQSHWYEPNMLQLKVKTYLS